MTSFSVAVPGAGRNEIRSSGIPTQPLPQVGQGLYFGRGDRRLRHNDFLAVRDPSMHLAVILTPRGFLGKGSAVHMMALPD